MALRAVPDHPKFANLKAILHQPKGPVMGWLELMWHFTGRFTPRGNIGKYTDTEIESWLEWSGEPGILISAFVEAKWIDRDETHRLLVHDWAIHADKATKNALKRSNLEFCTPTVRTHSPNIGTPYPLPVPVPVPVPVPEPVPVPGSITFELRSPSLSIDEEFDQLFWPVIWGKWARGKAIKAYRTARKKADFSIILAAVESQKPKILQQAASGFSLLPSTWLNDERWRDEAEIAPTNGHGPPRRFKTRQEEMMEEVMGEMK